jgi:hypothetical protein
VLTHDDGENWCFIVVKIKKILEKLKSESNMHNYSRGCKIIEIMILVLVKFTKCN